MRGEAARSENAELPTANLAHCTVPKYSLPGPPSLPHEHPGFSWCSGPQTSAPPSEYQ